MKNFQKEKLKFTFINLNFFFKVLRDCIHLILAIILLDLTCWNKSGPYFGYQ